MNSLESLREDKTKLEKNLLDLIKGFEEKYGINIESVNLEDNPLSFGHDIKTSHVECVIKI